MNCYKSYGKSSKREEIAIAKKMLGAYQPHYAPPSSSLEFLQSVRFGELSKDVTLYYQGDPNQAKYLATQRDPTNLENRTFYSKNHSLDWNTSGFNVEFCKKPTVLPTNIAIACPTPVSGSCNEVLFINSIGFGFDSDKQPHYQYYSRNGWMNIVQDFAVNFDMVFRCAQDYRKNKVILCYLGGGWFSELYPKDFLTTLYLPALELSLSRTPKKPTHIGIMGNVDSKISNGVKKIMDNYGIKFQSVGFVSNILTDENTLYQNAWDPHSMVGNGNRGDNSLDGFVGRCTNMHFLCWPPTNPNIKYKSI